MKKIKLVKGTFEPEDALEILADLITRKITFHKSKSMSLLLRKGMPDVHSDLRAEELNIDLELLKKIINDAKLNHAMIKAESYIEIEILEGDELLSGQKTVDSNQTR